MTLILPVWVGWCQCSHSSNVFSLHAFSWSVFSFSSVLSSYILKKTARKTQNNHSWIFQLLLTLSASSCWVRGKVRPFKKNKNHESVSRPCSKPCRVWVGGMAQEGNSCLDGLESCLSGEAVQVAYGNKDCATRLCVFGIRVSLVWPTAQYDTPSILPKAKQWGNYQARNAK